MILMKGRKNFSGKNSKVKSKKYLVCLLALLITGVVSGQSVFSKIPATGNSYLAFIPAGYDTLATARGDLNKDSLEDLALVLKSVIEDKSPGTDMEPPQRILVILLKTRN